jgi:GT2 family glycosyltransferase
MGRALWVMIAAAGKPELLARTLKSLTKTKKPVSYHGTVVVENGPRCGIEAVVRGFAPEHRFQHLYVSAGNKSHALNCGLTWLDDGLVFMTDDDVRLDADCLMAYDAAAGGVSAGEFFGGPVLIDAEHGLPPEWLRRFYPFSIVTPWSLPYSERTATPGRNFMGTNWAAFASDLIAAGGFDTRVGPGGTTGSTGQETDMQLRLAARGARAVYVPDAVSWHHLHQEFLEPQWVLQRAYRHGLEWGIRQTRGRRFTAHLLAHAALRRFNAHTKGLALRLLGGEQQRFEAAFHEAKWRGRWEGMQIGQQWDQLPPIHIQAPTSSARAA